MKRILSICLALTFALSLFACGPTEPGEPLKYEYDLADYVTVTQYKGMELTKSDAVPSKDDYDAYKKEDFAGVEVDRAAKEGDTVIIDYTGKKDGVAFEGGTAQMQSLTLGSGQFIDGFEEGLVGVKPGETVDLDLTFPKGYHNTDLAGKAVVFTVKMHYIKNQSETIPTLTDALVATVTEYKTVAEYEAAMEAELTESMLLVAVQEKLYNDTVFHKIPESAKKAYRDDYVQGYKDAAAAYGMSFSSYLAQNGTNEQAFLAQANSYAEELVKADLILYTIVRAENINPTEADRKEALQELFDLYAADYNLKTIDEMTEMLGETETDKLILNQMMLDFICENAVITE